MSEMIDVSVPLRDEMYRRLKRWADERRQGVGEAIAELLDEALPVLELSGDEAAASDPDFEREKAAYFALFPMLRTQYYGRYVAIHGGRLVDHDETLGPLVERLTDRFPQEFVWLSQVEDEPMPTIHIRSPRLVDNAR